MSKFLITAAIKAKAEEMTLRKGEGMISQAVLKTETVRKTFQRDGVATMLSAAEIQ